MPPSHQTARNDDPLPLVLLPGTLCDERVFEPLLARLPGITCNILLTPHASSMQQAAEHVLQQAPPHFALLGFSLGGMVAMEIATAAPDRVRGLALVSTSPLPAPANRHAPRRALVNLAGTMPMDVFARLHLWPDYCGPHLTDAAAHTQPLIEAMARSLGRSAFHAQTEAALLRPDYRPTLSQIRCPALVLAGEHDTLCPPHAQQTLHQGLTNSTLHMIQDAGHLALLEQPDEMAHAVAAWFHTVLEQQHTRDLQAPRQESE